MLCMIADGDRNAAPMNRDPEQSEIFPFNPSAND
jgi:hypothetical protein